MVLALVVVKIILGQGETACITFIYCLCVAVLDRLLGLVVAVKLLGAGLFLADKCSVHFETFGLIFLCDDTLIDDVLVWLAG